MRRIVTSILVGLVGAFGVTACGDMDHSEAPEGTHMDGGDHGMGGSDNRPVAPGARPIPVTADALRFDPRRIEIAAGEEVRIVLKSEDLAHDLFVEGVGHIVHARAGSTAQGGLSVDEPGTYDFWCTVRGHKEGGMTGTLVVTG